MDKKEKIFIVVATTVILLAIFIAFIISNSQKEPPEVLVQNEDRKIVSAVRGGYTWKVFGTNIIADAIDLKTYEYSSENTIVSKSGGILTISTTEKFSVQDIDCIEMSSNTSIETLAKNNETGNYFTINTPENEGTYFCLFKLDYYGKGTSEYAVKIVVTDENVYEVADIIEYKNTNILDVGGVKEILSKLPYNDVLNGIVINSANVPTSIKIKYVDETITKDDLLNNTIALFALIPDLETITYEINYDGDEIYYTRTEVNNILGKNVLEYADDMELWIKEIIYKEPVLEYNNDITIYASVINTALSNFKEREIGKFVAIDISENNTSGEISMDEYDTKTLLDKLSVEYDLILNVNKNEFVNTDGTLVIVKINEKMDNAYIVNVTVESSDGKKSEFVYKAVKDTGAVSIENYDGTSEKSGDIE